MPCIIGFRKEAEVGEFKPLYHLHFFFKGFHAGPFLKRGMSKHQGKEDDVEGEVYQEKVRFSHED